MIFVAAWLYIHSGLFLSAYEHFAMMKAKRIAMPYCTSFPDLDPLQSEKLLDPEKQDDVGVQSKCLNHITSWQCKHTNHILSMVIELINWLRRLRRKLSIFSNIFYFTRIHRKDSISLRRLCGFLHFFWRFMTFFTFRMSQVRYDTRKTCQDGTRKLCTN